MPKQSFELEFFRRVNGEVPFQTWLRRLDSRRDRARILERLTRLEAGHFGDVRSVGDGVLELRLHHGPGFRIYVARARAPGVVVLLGGSKGTQKRDIARARLYWREHERRSRR